MQHQHLVTTTGIGGWGRNSLRRYFKRGVDPNDDFAGGVMVEVIDDKPAVLEPRRSRRHRRVFKIDSSDR